MPERNTVMGPDTPIRICNPKPDSVESVFSQLLERQNGSCLHIASPQSVRRLLIRSLLVGGLGSALDSKNTAGADKT